MNLSNNKILITGGATGIGLGLTERFVSENNTVIICGRRADVLQEVADRLPNVITRVCDLSSEQDRVALYDWIKENHNDLNVLINNAGVQHWMHITEDNFYEKASLEVNTNILAPVHLNSMFINLPALRTIINVTSGLAFTPVSRVPVYCSTKAFMRSFTMAMRQLLQDHQIEVIEMIPPALNTDLGGKGLHNGHPEVSDFVNSIFEQLKEGKHELTFGTTEARLKGHSDFIAAHSGRRKG